MSQPLPTAAPIRDLGDGLIVRHATPADAEALYQFNGTIHSDEPGEFDSYAAIWTRDLLTRPHPTVQPGDFLIVEEQATGRVVSSLGLLGQTWTYEGIPFGVGRPELVGTLPEFRKRGLVRLQFEIVHAWSRQRGQMVQVITGIPYYYRQFGYEMALNVGGSRSGFAPQVPQLPADQTEPYTFRPATAADLPFLVAVYEHAIRRDMVAVPRDAELWRYELEGRTPGAAMERHYAIIERVGDGEPVGVVGRLGGLPPHGGAVITYYELKPGVSWLPVTPSVVRYLDAFGRAEAEKPDRKYTAWVLALGGPHPAYEAMGDRLPRVRDPYAYFVRVPDVAGFLRHITPVLERRLAESIAVGHTGTLRLNFYRRGVQLDFQDGRLTDVQDWQPSLPEEGDALFPDLSFLHLLFGHRTLNELRAHYPDCFATNDAAAALIQALFPKRHSNTWAVA